ncbi:translation initiation factor IF-3 [Rickettsia endosymbiont of Oedothorax gibbosus]|uniref:translation initiation factor IF-3 n=1 Tax=Rickettsia endosymbiont of Oedothorax gibbosus TaxID=931099 RepID=UPI0024E0EB90|nr:translation initiation factor IF-3 [Rickettsia endosymbiont of Oedothorax gibbosus]
MSGVKSSNFPKANREIRASQVRLVGENGEMLGIVSIREALEYAEKAALDLVEISPNAEPPVCKILNFSKFKYDSKKRIQDSRKKQRIIVLKEMKFKPNISQGDFDVKLRKIKDFLKEGDKVKISLWFKGREIIHNDIGMKLFDRILLELEGLAKIDSAPKMEGKQIIMLVSPNTIKIPTN